MEMLFATSPSWAITVIRVTLGVIFFAHGAQKVFGWFGGYGLKGTTGILRLDWITASGGLRRLFSGAAWRPFTRLAALAIIAMMAGAVAKVHGRTVSSSIGNWPPAKAMASRRTSPSSRWRWPVIGGGGALSLDALLMG